MARIAPAWSMPPMRHRIQLLVHVPSLWMYIIYDRLAFVIRLIGCPFLVIIICWLCASENIRVFQRGHTIRLIVCMSIGATVPIWTSPRFCQPVAKFGARSLGLLAWRTPICFSVPVHSLRGWFWWWNIAVTKTPCGPGPWIWGGIHENSPRFSSRG